MKYQTVMVSPQKAESWLQQGGKNRKISQTHVSKLAALMRNGHWVLNGQTLSFSADGKLLDGQHRLNAIIQAGVTIPMSIAIGVIDERAFESYDSAIRKRSVTQIANMENIKNATHIVAISRRLLFYETTTDKTKFTFGVSAWGNLSNQDVLSYMRKNLEEIQSVFNDVRCSPPFIRCGAGSALVTALIICNRADSIITSPFMEGLKTGVSLSVNSPVYMLREKLISGSKKRGIKWETEVMALTIKAWNKHAKGNSVKFLRWRQEGDAPEYFPLLRGVK